MDNISYQRLAPLYPELARRWTSIDAALLNQGIQVRITAGLRTWEQQDALYAQGRSAPGKIVTYAQGGQSWHNYGCAIDVVPMLNGQPVWSLTDPAWATISNLAKQWGFVAGADWSEPETDPPHLQLTGAYAVSPRNDVQALYSMHGFAGVWQAMNDHYSIAASASDPDLYICNPYN